MLGRILVYGALLVATAVVGLGVGVLVALPNHIHASKVDPAVADADLAVHRPVVADADNGYLALERAASQLVWIESEAGDDSAGASEGAAERPREPGPAAGMPPLGAPASTEWRARDQTHLWQDEQAERMLPLNDAALTTLAAMRRAPAYQSPAWELDDAGPDVQRWQQLYRLLACRAVQRARAGKTFAARDDVLMMLDIAGQMRSEPGATTSHAAIGIDLQEIALRALMAVTPHLELTPAMSRTLTRALGRYETDPAAWREGWAGHFQQVKRVLMEQRIPGLDDLEKNVEDLPGWLREYVDPAYFYKPNETVALYADLVRSVQRRADEPCSTLDSLGEDPDYTLMDALRPNALGRVLVDAAASGVRSTEERRCYADTLLAATRTHIALRGYEHEHGHYPDTLDELVPGFIHAVPRGAFDDRDLVWEASARTVSGTRISAELFEVDAPASGGS